MSAEPLRLLYVADSLGLGGANQTTVTVAVEMRRRGHEVWLASEGGPLGERLERAGVGWIEVRTDVRHPHRPTRGALERALREHRIRLACPNGFACTVETIPAALSLDVPVFPTYGGLYTPSFPHPWLPRVNVFSQEFAADLQRRHGFRADEFRNLIARIDGTRFHPGVGGGSLRAEHGIASDAKLIVTVCRLDATKLQGALVLLDAAARLRKAVPGLRILLFGDGDSTATVHRRIAATHAAVGEEFIVAPGSTANTAEAFAAADLVVANGARSALEGMACGRPVVSVGPNGFDGVFSAETIEGFRRFNFDKGRLAGNPLDAPDDLVVAARRILLEAPLRERLSRFSQEYARENLVVQSAAGAYERAYRETISDPWPRPGDRRRVRRRWRLALLRFYAYRLRRRIFGGRGRAAPYDELLPPPEGVDPDWRMGLPPA